MADVLDQERLARLKAELVAIDRWDETYRRDQEHDIIDEVSLTKRDS